MKSPTRWLPAAAFVTVLVVLATFALLSPGYPVRKLNLNDSGIWVTNNAEALYGRLNKSVESLDGLLGPAGGTQGAGSFALDVVQDESRVVARDLLSGRVTPVDAAGVAHQIERGITLAPTSLLDLRAGSVAVLDPVTGNVWAGRFGEDDTTVDLGAVDANQKVVAELGEAAPGAVQGQEGGLSIGVDGVVHAVSSNGRSVTLRPDGLAFAEPQYAEGAPRAAVQVAAVGEGVAVLDAEAGALTLPDGAVVAVDADPRSRLQRASEAADTVAVATASGLFAADRSGLAPLADGNGNAPAVPVVLGGCTFAAWAGEPGVVVRSCDGEPGVAQGGLEGVPLVAPVFRTNHGLILLNDTSDGKVYSFEEQRFVQNWTDAQPLPATDDGDPEQEARPNEDEPPTANPDTIGARPGRTTVAHVLDNDTDALGRILTVTGVTQPSSGASAQVAPDGQTVLVTLPSDATATSFQYSIDNGSTSASATVTVDVRSEAENGEPHLRPGAPERTHPVASWGTLVMPVTADWRDPDGDPVAVHSVEAPSLGVAGITTDGRVTFTADRADDTTLVPLAVNLSDGRGELVPSVAQVKVLGHRATEGDAPVPQPDAVRGEVGKPLVISPLGNDLPGADPLNPRAVLELAAPVQGADGLTVDTDLRSGVVTVTAAAARTYFLDYTAKFGSAQFAQGQIRVDMAEPGPSRPTAAPDHVTVRGQAGVMVDVLANDTDPTGSVLTVLAAVPEDTGADGGQLQVAVLKGRWLRIMPRVETLSPATQVVTYTMTNGLSEPVTGSVVVTQLPRPPQDAAVVNDDFTTVRVGDSVLVPVLENDSSTSGEPLELDRNVPDLPGGELRVIDPNVPQGQEQGDVGHAYVVNDQVRYVAPAELAAERQVRVEYQAQAPAGTPETGVLHVTVTPAPSEENPNTAPQPQNLEARVSAGQTIEIPIEPWRQDADGDTVTVLGLASAPTKGRVLGFSPNALTYQAYPGEGNGGTDVFRYRVTDAHGATETGLVRVAITEPGAVQAPVAVADTVIAAPDTEVQLHALSNDMFDEVDPPTVVPFEDMGNEVPEGVSLGGPAGPILARTARGADAPTQFAYALRNSGGVGPAAQVTVRAQDGYLNPPRTYDEVAEADGVNATVDALRRTWDPDGPKSAMRISAVSNPEATVDGGTVTIPLRERPQAVTYVVTDATGASSASVLFVPAGGSGVPHLVDGSQIEVAPNSTFSFDVNDYVRAPRGTPVTITVAESLASSPGQVTVTPDSDTRLTLTTVDDYSGPAAVTFEVRDGDPDDPLTQTAVISIPVQVGSATPVLRCPPFQQRLVQGGPAVDLRIAAICSVWTPDPAQAAGLAFTADWAEGVRDVTATAQGQVVTVVAGSNARPGDLGVLRVAVDGFPDTAKEMGIEVVAAPRPRLVVSDITDVQAGTAVSQTIQLSSPLAEPEPTIVSFERVGGMEADTSFQGSRFTVTPRESSHGVMVFRVVASDLADRGRTDRHVEATLRVTVFGVPDKMAPPQPSMQLRSEAASVTFSPPADNGAPILEYEVTGGGKTVNCGRATRCDITGLANGVPVSFQVRARNRAGWSEPSDPGPSVTPDEAPGRVPSFTASNPTDGSVTLAWQPALNRGSPVTRYVITYGGQSQPVPGGSTSTVVSGLNNNAVYTFTIVAQNNAGTSQEPTSTTGQSSGRPVMSGVSVGSSDLGSSAQVTVSWPGADPQGPRPVTYTVTRSGGSAGARTWTGVTGTSLGDQVAYDGSVYTYAVTATNATGGAAHTSAPVSTQFRATGKPAAWAGWTATPTGADGTLRVSYTVPPSRGSTSTVTLHGAGGPRTMASGSATSSTSFNGITVGGLTNGTGYSMYLKVCNENNACSLSAPVSATPYGPLGAPTLQASASGNTVTWSATGSGNGRTAVLTVSDDAGGSARDQGAGSLRAGVGSREVGYDRTVTVTATLSDPAGGRESRTVTQRVTTGSPPPPPKTVRVWQGPDVGFPDGCPNGYYLGGGCRRIGITTTGFEGQSYQCHIYLASGGTGWRYTFTGNYDGTPAPYTGYDTYVYANCGGVIGSVKW